MSGYSHFNFAIDGEIKYRDSAIFTPAETDEESENGDSEEGESKVREARRREREIGVSEDLLFE